MAAGGSLPTLVKLFYLGMRLPADEAVAALTPLILDRLEAIHVLRVSGDLVDAQIEIDTLDDLLVASDRAKPAPAQPDHASPMSVSSFALVAATPRHKVERALDVGTGTGAQALLLSHHAQEVVATDVNPRALAFARFNAAMNGVRNITFREGSLFEPVEGDTFDLVVCNPPFVIGPAAEYLFRDSGLPGDTFVEALVRGVPGHLREGGISTVLLNWIVGPEENWQAPLERWVEESGCDALLVGRSSWKALDYAAASNFPLRTDPAAFGVALDRWVAHIDSLGLDSIAGGLVVLRRRAGTNWMRAFDAPVADIEPSGDQLIRLIDAQDFLLSHDDDALLDARLAAAPELLIELRPAGWRSRLALERGLGLRVDVDSGTVNLLVKLDGKATLREALLSAQADPQEGLVTAKRMIEFGYVVPADSYSSQVANAPRQRRTTRYCA